MSYCCPLLDNIALPRIIVWAQDMRRVMSIARLAVATAPELRLLRHRTQVAVCNNFATEQSLARVVECKTQAGRAIQLARTLRQVTQMLATARVERIGTLSLQLVHCHCVARASAVVGLSRHDHRSRCAMRRRWQHGQGTVRAAVRSFRCTASWCTTHRVGR